MANITVKLFAAYQEAYGQPELMLDIPAGTTVAMVGERIREPFPLLHALAEVTRYGVNLAFVDPDTILQEGDEVVLIPPVSGG
jgi:molybdopterin synthase sulfur carrier subunit